MITTREKAAAFHLSFCLAGLDKLKRRVKPKSREWNRIDAAEDIINRLLDCYQLAPIDMGSFVLAGINLEDVAKATEIFDLMEAAIEERYPGTGKALACPNH